MFSATFRGCTQTFHIFSLLQFEEPFAWQGYMKRIETASINDTAGSESQLASRAGEGWGCDHAAFTVQASATLKLQHGQSSFCHTPGLRHVAASRIVTCNIL